jgi:proline iminopeptidase
MCFVLGCKTQNNSAANPPHNKQSVPTFYRTFGKGKPILILNGGPGMNSDGFAYIAETISKMGYQTIIYDQRGTGKSQMDSLNNQTITMDLMAEDMENLRKKLNISTWILFGHSFGGLLATHYAAKYPQPVEKIIFSSSGGVNLQFINSIQERIQANLTQTERDSLNFYQKLVESGDLSLATRICRARFLANAYVYDKSNGAIIAERLTQGNAKVNGLVFQDLQKIKYNYANKFNGFKKPVLVIHGKNDIISPATAEETHKTFPNSKLVLLDRCAHYGWLDSKEKYLQEMEPFLKK